MSVTTDNASSRVSFIEALATDTADFKRPFLRGYWIRCLSHVVNLAVQASLTQFSPHLETVREFIFKFFTEMSSRFFFSLAPVFSESHKQFASTPTEVQVCHVSRRYIPS